jgi:hypothetical protein
MVGLNLARLALLTLAVGCASTGAQAPRAPQSAANPPPRVRMAWLPCDSRAQRDLVVAVNGQFEQAKVAGVTASFQAPVSMEMAQLAIECIEKTPHCYTAVGRSIGADRLLWADLERSAQGAQTLRVSLFDVERGAIVRAAEGRYASTKAAVADVAALVTRVQAPERLADAGKAP